jgi:hypothetical protein
MYSVRLPYVKYESLYRPDLYTFHKEKGWLSRKIQRACFWALEKLGCGYMEVTSAIDYVEVDYKDIIDALIAQRRAIQDVLQLKCRVVVMGEDYMDALRLSDPVYWGLGLPRDVSQWVRPYDTGMELVGLKVIFCPWMQGMAALPDIKLLGGY